MGLVMGTDDESRAGVRARVWLEIDGDKGESNCDVSAARQQGNYLT
jgi:hypothetical protein